MTFAHIRQAAEHIAHTGNIMPHQLAAFSGLWESMSDEQRQAFTDLWRAEGSPAAKAPPVISNWVPVFSNNWDSVTAAAKLVGAKYPELVGAQWAVESGFGKHLSGKHNYFGLKGAGNAAKTQEFINGRWVTITADFLDFPDLLSCVRYLVERWYLDYRAYKGCNNAPTRNDAARWLAKEGYATDPAYADKLIKRMSEHAPAPKLSVAPATAPKPVGVIVPAGMVGPRMAPPIKLGDYHLVADNRLRKMTAYSHDGKRLWTIPCLCNGQAGWRVTGGDTPPGLYKVGKAYRDYEQDANPPFTRDRRSYGWYSFDLLGLEGQEGPNSKPYRDGIMLHGGGSECGWPGAWAPQQTLHSTLGCIRLYNIDLRDKILPLYGKGSIWVSVLQEAS